MTKVECGIRRRKHNISLKIEYEQAIDTNDLFNGSASHTEVVATEYMSYRIGETSIITIAKEYGNKLGAIGRLMTINEVVELKEDYPNLILGKEGCSNNRYFNYCLGYANHIAGTWCG